MIAAGSHAGASLLGVNSGRAIRFCCTFLSNTPEQNPDAVPNESPVPNSVIVSCDRGPHTLSLLCSRARESSPKSSNRSRTLTDCTWPDVRASLAVVSVHVKRAQCSRRGRGNWLRRVAAVRPVCTSRTRHILWRSRCALAELADATEVLSVHRGGEHKLAEHGDVVAGEILAGLAERLRRGRRRRRRRRRRGVLGAAEETHPRLSALW